MLQGDSSTTGAWAGLPALECHSVWEEDGWVWVYLVFPLHTLCCAHRLKTKRREQSTSPCDVQAVGEGATVISETVFEHSIYAAWTVKSVRLCRLRVSTHSVLPLPPLQLQHLWSGCLTRLERRPSGLWSGLWSHWRLAALRRGQAVRVPDQTRATPSSGDGDDGGRRYGQAGGHVVGVRLWPDHRKHPRHQSGNHRVLQVSGRVRGARRAKFRARTARQKSWDGAPPFPGGLSSDCSGRVGSTINSHNCHFRRKVLGERLRMGGVLLPVIRLKSGERRRSESLYQHSADWEIVYERLGNLLGRKTKHIIIIITYKFSNKPENAAIQVCEHRIQAALCCLCVVVYYVWIAVLKY